MLDLLQYPKTVTFFLIILQALVRKVYSKHKKPPLPYPPGPAGYPIIGNFFDLPTKQPEKEYSELLNRYGDMVYLESLGTKILVLGSTKRTTDLLETRSSIYSDRPHSPMLEQMGYDAYFSLLPYGSRWRRERKMFHEHFNQSVVPRFHASILEERNSFIEDLMAHPDTFWDRTRMYMCRIILRGTYGISPKSHDDPCLTQPRIVSEGFNNGGRTGAYMVDLIPALKYVPDWMPGTGWKSVARYYHDVALQARTEPFEHVREMHRKGDASPCATLSLIENLPDEDDPAFAEEALCARDSMALAFLGGADTSVGVASTTFLLLTMHPEIQKRAQAEIDSVVGPGRLPEFADRERLVFLNAILKEVARLYQVFPLAVAHSLTEDDVYDGYFIPKGTIVIGNAWHILHDPQVYPDPFTFNPDRFMKDGKLNADILDPYDVMFGFGRRICPGRHLSHDTLFALVSSTLACFELSPPKDSKGNAIPPKWEFEGGLLIHPKRFDCVFTSRSEKHKRRFRASI